MNATKAIILCAAVAAAPLASAAPAFNDVENAIINTLIEDDLTAFMNGTNNMIGPFLKADGKEVLIVDPFQYSIDYNENEIRANQQYKGKTLYFRNCQVMNITAGINDAPILSCLSPAAYRSPQLHFKNNKTSLEFASQLRKGSRVDVVCEGAGEIAGMPMADKCRPNTEFFNAATKRLRKEFTDTSSVYGLYVAGLSARIDQKMTAEEKEQCKTNCREIIKNYRAESKLFLQWLPEVKPRLIELGFKKSLKELEDQLEAKKNQQKQ